MKYQTNPELGPFLNKWGCHFCDILEKVEKRCQVKFSNNDTLTIYLKCMQFKCVQKEVFENGLPKDGCDILDGVGVFNYAAMQKGSHIYAKSYRKESKDYLIKSNEEEILELQRDGYKGSHFVSGNGVPDKDNWRREVEFDSIEVGSQCVKLGWIVSKRILEF